MNFSKRLSTLQGTLTRLQPSFVLMLRILITCTLSVVDYVLSAIRVQAEWVQPQQVQIKRIACKAMYLRLTWKCEVGAHLGLKRLIWG